VSQTNQMPRAGQTTSMPGGGKTTSQFGAQFNNANNVFDRSNAALGAGMEGAASAMAYNPMQVNPQGYQAQYVDPSKMGQGYNAAQVGTANRSLYEYDPRMVQAGSYGAEQLAGRDLSAYTNPYENTVVNQSLSDIERARKMAANQTDAQATAMGAFGGSRQALMASENNRNFLDQSARTAGQLRQQGYQNAQNMALQDIGALNNASQFNIANDMQAQLANQSADAQARQFGGSIAANQYMQSQMANAAARDNASRFGAQNQIAGMLANQSAGNQAGQFNSQQNLQGQLANQSAGMQGAQMRLGAAGQLGNLANLGFGLGQQANGMMGAGGAQQRQIQQQLINAARGQFAGFANAPQNSLSLLAQALGGVPYGQSMTKNPGLFDYLTLGASLF